MIMKEIPWKRVGYGVFEGSVRVADCHPDNGLGVPHLPTEQHAVTTANLIVRAVNSHEDVIHTLANALHELRSVNANQFIIQQCEKAIAQAEKGA